jgi:hypothetical protein
MQATNKLLALLTRNPAPEHLLCLDLDCSPSRLHVLIGKAREHFRIIVTADGVSLHPDDCREAQQMVAELVEHER